jgi:hypothetical protein
MGWIMNFPAVSDERAMRLYSQARDNERRALLELVDLQPGSVVLDIQAAGGYLSDGVYAQLQGDVSCVCVEPCELLRKRLSKAYRVIDNPVHDFFDVASDSVNTVLGLAGLHHSASHLATVSESFRVLQPGGMFAVCDVISASDIARWLNDFVDANNPSGHKGVFLEGGQLTDMMIGAGFAAAFEEVKYVPWVFASEQDMVTFFKGLFGLTCPLSKVREAIHDYFTIRRDAAGVSVDWRLIYGSGRKP